MKFNTPILFGIVYHGQQADGTAGTKRPIHGGCSYHPLDDILPPPPTNRIDHIGEESDNDAERHRQNPRSFPMTKTGFQLFE